MADTGTAIERAVEGALDRADNATSVGGISPNQVAVVRDAHARRVDLAGRVLSLLSSLGDLALRLMEQRADSGSGTAAGVAMEASDAAVRPDQPRIGSARQQQPGQGRRPRGLRRRQRWQGGL
jgi:hypothetical protein